MKVNHICFKSEDHSRKQNCQYFFLKSQDYAKRKVNIVKTLQERCGGNLPY